jgi:O-antigen/teichoic acid export membrane protein
MGEPRLALWILVLPVSVVLVGWYQALRFWTMRREAFGDVARNVVTRTAAGAGFACVFGMFPPLPEAPEGGLILSQMLGEAFGNLLLAYRILRRDKALCFWPGWYRLLAAARRWRSLALPLAAAQGIAIGYGRLPVLAITWLFGPAAAGHYAWAERFAVVPAQLVATAIGDVYRQRATVEYHRSGRFDRLMRRTLAVTTVIGVVPFALGIAIAPALFAWLFGPVWREAGVLAQILMVGGFVSFVVSPVDKAAVIFRRTRYMLAWHLARFGLKLGVIATAVFIDLSLATVLWLIVAVRIGLYCFDVVYEYRLAKGRSF